FAPSSPCPSPPPSVSPPSSRSPLPPAPPVSAPPGFPLPTPPGPPVSAPTGSPWPARRAHGTRPRTLPPTHHTPAYAPRTTILRAHTPTPAHTQLERWRSSLFLAGRPARKRQRRGSAVPFASISV